MDKVRLVATIIDYHNKKFGNNEIQEKLSRLSINYIYYILNVLHLDKHDHLLIKNESFEAGRLSPYSNSIYPGLIINTFDVKLQDVKNEVYWDERDGCTRFKKIELYQLYEFPGYFEYICKKVMKLNLIELSEFWKKDPNYKYVKSGYYKEGYKSHSLDYSDFMKSKDYILEVLF